MIDISTESLIRFRDLPEYIATRTNDRPPSMATLHRWRLKGRSGLPPLETVKIGGARYTSKQALDRFFNREQLPASPAASATQNRVSASAIEASKRLEAAGA